MIIRVRTKLGTWRLNDVQDQDTLYTLKQRLLEEHNASVGNNFFSSDAEGKILLDDDSTVKGCKLTNGAMIYINVDSVNAVHEHASALKTIAKDGSIIAKSYDSVAARDGFRPGMMPLRSMKMHWTLNEFMDLDSKFVYKVKRQEAGVCKKVSLETKVVQEFQAYMRTLDYRRIRVAYLYGEFKSENSARVEFMYEPLQESTDLYFKLLEDEEQQRKVDTIVSYLGYKKVGWIISHPPREDGFYFSGYETMFAAEQQLECAGGVDNPETPFVTVRMTLDTKENNNVVVEAFQFSKQCMEMVAESVIAPSHNLGRCNVNDTFTAIVEGKPAKEVDNTFFLINVPIEQHSTSVFVSLFPRANRDGYTADAPSKDALKKQLSTAGRGGWTFIDMVADFQLLLYLSNFLDIEVDMRNICSSVVHREIPLDEGYNLIIRSIAGLDM